MPRSPACVRLTLFLLLIGCHPVTPAAPPTVATRSARIEAGASAAGTLHLVVIGIDDYQQDAWTDLRAAEGDAADIASLLADNYGFQVDALLLGREATLLAVWRAVSTLRATVRPEDSVVVYFAGHGALDGDVGYWVPWDGGAPGLDAPPTWLSNSQLHDQLRAIPARHILVIADTCYAGALASTTRDAPRVKDDEWYAAQASRSSRWVLASGDVEKVLDGSDRWEGHSVFTWALLDALKPSPDHGRFTLSELAPQLSKSVRSESNAVREPGQTPRYERMSGDGGGEFVFSVVKAAEAPPPLSDEQRLVARFRADSTFRGAVLDLLSPPIVLRAPHTEDPILALRKRLGSAIDQRAADALSDADDPDLPAIRTLAARIADAEARKADSTRDVATLRQLTAAGQAAGTLGTSARQLADGIEVGIVRRRVDTFARHTFTGDEHKDIKLLTSTWADEEREILATLTGLLHPGIGLAAAVEILTLRARASFAYADLFYASPPPPSLSPEETSIYFEFLDKKRLPLEDAGKAAAQRALEIATRAGIWPAAADDAEALLHDRYPHEYPSWPEEQCSLPHAAPLRAVPADLNAAHVPGILALAGMALDNRRYEEAWVLIRGAAELAPDSEATRLCEAAALRGLGRLSEAETVLTAAVAAPTARPDARYNLGLLRAYQGRFEDAVAELRAYLTAVPTDKAATDLMSQFEREGRRRAARAGRAAAQAATSDPAADLVGTTVRGGPWEMCVEAMLKRNPTAAGRITLGWSIVAGRSGDVQVLHNETGDADLAACMVDGVRGLRFDAGVTATINSYSWVVSGQ